MRAEREVSEQLLGESQAPLQAQEQPRRTQRSNAGKASLRLKEDPTWLGTQAPSSAPEETHLTMTEALATQAAKKRELEQVWGIWVGRSGSKRQAGCGYKMGIEGEVGEGPTGTEEVQG